MWSHLSLHQELATGDLVGLGKDQRDGVTFYEWDIALSPKTCPQEKQLIQGLCFPDTVRGVDSCEHIVLKSQYAMEICRFLPWFF